MLVLAHFRQHLSSEERFTRLFDVLGLCFCSAYDQYPVIGVAKHLHGGLVFAFEAAALPDFIGSFVHLLVGNAIVLTVPFIETMQVNVRQQR
jgi:hypothetical protein